MKIGNIECYGVIYKIENLVNHKVYIGQTTKKRGFKDRYCCNGKGIERVYNYHLKSKERGHCRNEHLFNSIIKYGFNKFEVCEIFDVAFSLKELNTKEECWINIYNSTNSKLGYNFRKGGDNYEFSEDSLVRNGNPIVCINTNKQYKSLEEAGRIYNTCGATIKKTLTEKRTEYNLDKYLFRIPEDRDKDKLHKRCSYCGKIFKLHKINNKNKNRRLHRLNWNEHYCTYCKSNNRSLPKGMTKIPK